ncbi:YafY family transcriptional regulator [Niastella caeni]|uniref:YafY family transcriptional regulator n=1 Tax=Niastella caeni TaxID=2569763 RepID=A0A4S8I1L9_9BACT|nr:YafY family protein [Niastella caeni]THU41591.1 YafY family transcriptional regulator [Niastella caeni]
MNRIDRLHAILTHLQSKKRVTAQEVADRFNISLRTVYRDVKALEESGVPVIGEAGSGYTIMEGYRLPPVMFTQEEASALLLGAKLTEHLSDESIKKHFNAALFKIKAVLRSSDKEHMDQLNDNIAVFSRLPADDSAGRYLVELQKALGDKKEIHIRYQSGKDAVTERSLEPIGLCHYGQAWHLIGWCKLRNGYRDFRVSRIQHLQILDKTFEADAHPSLREYMESMISSSELQEVVVRFDKTTARHIGNQKYYYGYVREEAKDDYVYMYYVTTHLEYFGRWLLTYTHHVTVESPEALVTIMRDLSEEIRQHYLPVNA